MKVMHATSELSESFNFFACLRSVLSVEKNILTQKAKWLKWLQLINPPRTKYAQLQVNCLYFQGSALFYCFMFTFSCTGVVQLLLVKTQHFLIWLLHNKSFETTK